jgi:hypothetical protein
MMRSLQTWTVAGLGLLAGYGPQADLIGQTTEAKTPAPAVVGQESKPGVAAAEAQHPARTAQDWAKLAVTRMEQDIRDYSATLVKRERLNGKLGEQQVVVLKVRNKPFSIYASFQQPSRGDEAIYIEGKNDGHMMAHTTGMRARFARTIMLRVNGPKAMEGQRRPISDIGILNLARWMLQDTEKDLQHADCEVRYLKGVKVGDRVCTCVEIIRPAARKDVAFHKTRFFVDNQLGVPIRFEAYDWPRKTGDEPELVEEYTYRNLKLNPGFTERDFDHRNPQYSFPSSVRW